MTVGSLTLPNIAVYLFFLSLLCLIVSFIYNYSLSRRLSMLIRRHKALLQSSGNPDLDSIVNHLAGRVEKVEEKLDSIAQAYEVMAEDELSHVRSVSLVRFNAFERQGGEQSFSIAMLDAKGNGLILTSLYGSEDNRIYAKPIRAGNPEIPLSKEEIQALESARPR